MDSWGLGNEFCHLHALVLATYIDLSEKEAYILFEANVILGFLSLEADANPNQFRDQTGNSLGIWTVLVMIYLFICLFFYL